MRWERSRGGRRRKRSEGEEGEVEGGGAVLGCTSTGFFVVLFFHTIRDCLLQTVHIPQTHKKRKKNIKKNCLAHFCKVTGSAGGFSDVKGLHFHKHNSSCV